MKELVVEGSGVGLAMIQLLRSLASAPLYTTSNSSVIAMSSGISQVICTFFDSVLYTPNAALSSGVSLASASTLYNSSVGRLGEGMTHETVIFI